MKLKVIIMQIILDGIKLFEAARQATLASFHVMGVTFEGVMALTASLLIIRNL